MELKKTVKKIAAIAAGVTMVGATILGAAATDLSDYPSPFVQDGVFNGKIVVGANAQTQDVVGAIDIAASLQAESYSESAVELPTQGTSISFEGDSAEFKSGSDVLEIGESLSDVKETFTEDDMDMLETTTFSNSKGDTEVKHYLKFGDTSVNYQENDNDQVDNFLKFADGDLVFQYNMEFSEGAESKIEDGKLEDFEGEQLDVFGGTYTVVESNINGDDISLTLMGGQMSDVLSDGETKTYTVDGKDYEVTAKFISDNGDGEAKLAVNGEITKSLKEGDSVELNDEITIGVREVLTNGREGIVEFFLGANKLELSDSDFTSDDFSGKVTVNGESINSGELMIRGSVSGDDFTLNYIKYKLDAEDDYFVKSGEGLRETMDSDEREGLFSPNWDVKYTGLTDTETNDIEIKSVGGDSYNLEFTNVNGDKYDVPLMTNEDDTFKFGDKSDNLVFKEDIDITDEDYFVLSDKTDNQDEKAVTSVLQYKRYNDNDNTVEFKDLSGGTITASFIDDKGSLVVDGKTHKFELDGETLYMDLNGDGDIDNDKINLVAKGGELIKIRPTIVDDKAKITFVTPNDIIEGSSADEDFVVEINPEASEDIDLTVTSDFNFLESDNNDDVEVTYTRYGARVEKDSGKDSTEFTIEMPTEQRYAQAFVTSGAITAKDSTNDGDITTQSVNPIGVGLAILDIDAPAVGSQNMIVVGGPCANTVAAELMGNPEVCGEGFMPGKAIIKLFSDKNALLVAGYDAQDTLGATYVLTDYEDYDLKGDEVEVITADLNSIVVNPVIAPVNATA